MKVTLEPYNSVSLLPIYIAARRCVKADISDCIHDDKEKIVEVIHSCYLQGHYSVFEHLPLMFNIEGITRGCSHQLVRHRHFSFCQQSQRRVRVGTFEEYGTVASWALGDNKQEEKAATEIILKYFGVRDNRQFCNAVASFIDYWRIINAGGKPEDARAVLPECTLTNIVVSCNFRALMEACALRLCAKAQDEIRALFGLMKMEVLNSNEDGRVLSTFLLPKCLPGGHCNEMRTCGYFRGFGNDKLKSEGSEGGERTGEKDN